VPLSNWHDEERESGAASFSRIGTVCETDNAKTKIQLIYTITKKTMHYTKYTLIVGLWLVTIALLTFEIYDHVQQSASDDNTVADTDERRRNVNINVDNNRREDFNGQQVHGFYHGFVPHWSGATRAVFEQHVVQVLNSPAMASTDEMHVKLIANVRRNYRHAKTLFVESLEASKDTRALVSSDFLQFDRADDGNEVLSLANLHSHCVENRNDVVWYLHSKGALHASEANDALRQRLTEHVLAGGDNGCVALLTANKADVCGMRMSPYPHWHYPGNMFAARCDYVAKLDAPDAYERGAVSCRKNKNGNELDNDDVLYRVMLRGIATECTEQWRIGVGRFAAEHWIASLPNARFADCLAESEQPDGTIDAFVFGYDTARLASYPVHCERAPRPFLDEPFRQGRVRGFDADQAQLNARWASTNAKVDEALLSMRNLK
jgi:hypothetical protein